MNDPIVIVAFINAFFSLMSIIFTGFMAYFMARLNKKTENTAVKVNEVQEKGLTNESKLEKLAEVSKDTHTLVNNNMGIQLKIAMGLAARIAKLTKKKEDIADAKETRRLYEEHINKQNVVDTDVAERRHAKKQGAKPSAET